MVGIELSQTLVWTAKNAFRCLLGTGSRATDSMNMSSWATRGGRRRMKKRRSKDMGRREGMSRPVTAMVETARR